MYKFALIENLIEVTDGTNRFQRVFETFDHVVSVREDKIHRLYDSCKKYDIKCEILDEIKFIYENPLVDIYKNKEENERY